MAPSSSNKLVIVAVVAIVVLFLMTGRAGEGRCEAADVFGGEKWRTEQTLAARTVFSTRFGRCEVHKVSTDRGTVADWLWFDEPNAVNVVVHEASRDVFLVFKQTKYGLRKPTLAVLGGMVERAETAPEASRRELAEELKMETDEMVDLGTYRTAANRGGGWVTCFLAKNSRPLGGGGGGGGKELADDDLEARAVVVLTKAQLAERVLAGAFGEVKWTAAVAVALLHLDAEGSG